MWLYLDELQFKFEFRSGRMIFGWVMSLELVFFVQILSCPDFSLKSFDIYMKSNISKDVKKKYGQLKIWTKNTSSMAITQPNVIRPERNSNLNWLFFEVLWYIDLIFGMTLYLDKLQFKFEFGSDRMTFGWVMAIELIFFVQILSCPDFFWRPLIYLTWHLVCGYI
jgi:hypothetical protein